MKSPLSFLTRDLEPQEPALHLYLPGTHPTTGAASPSLHPKLGKPSREGIPGQMHQGAINRFVLGFFFQKKRLFLQHSESVLYFQY